MFYIYRCKQHGPFEKWLSPSSEGLDKSKCPECNKQCTRVYTTPGIAFKGSGFHVNDYNTYSKK